MTASTRLNLCLWLVLATAMLVASVDPGEDFSGYMEDLEQRQRDQAAFRQKMQEHEVRM